MNESFVLPAGRYMVGDYERWILDQLREVVDDADEVDFEENAELTFLVINDFADFCNLKNARGMEPHRITVPSRNFAILPECMHRDLPPAPWNEFPFMIDTPEPFKVTVTNLSIELKFYDRIAFIDGYNKVTYSTQD